MCRAEMEKRMCVCACVRASHNVKDLVRKRPVMYHFPFTKLPPLTGSTSQPRVVCVCVVGVEHTREGGKENQKHVISS